MTKEELMPIIDALIFASDVPISIQKIKQVLDEESPDRVGLKDIREALDELNKDNRTQQRGFFLQEVAGGYQYRTRPNYAPWIKKLKKTKLFRLTQSTLETLAIIAYKQPIIRAEIEKIRGVDSGGIIKNLLERSLIKIVGRKNIPGRPFLLGSTNRFLEVFGLEKLSDMPSLKEFENLDTTQLPTILQERVGDDIYDPESAVTDERDDTGALGHTDALKEFENTLPHDGEEDTPHTHDTQTIDTTSRSETDDELPRNDTDTDVS